PCIDVCDFSGPKGWCTGCGRTREECHKWKTMKPYALNTMHKELRKRMSQINMVASKK
ncbi:DUF1289 domain-containing protein, partial [Vibrio fluvialis]